VLQRSEAANPQMLHKVPRNRRVRQTVVPEIFDDCIKSRNPARSFMQMRA